MKLTFFTGAGISQESGIPTFRGASNSLWSKHDPAVVSSIQGLRDHLPQVLEFHNEARKLIDTCEPNLCHKFIAELQGSHEVTVITTNIDTLHEKAGSSKVIHIHGNLYEACDLDKANPYPYFEDIQIGDKHPETGKQLRHNTVLFGELLSANMWFINNKIVKPSDFLIVIGSSLSVWPSSEIVNYNKNILYISPDALPDKRWITIKQTAVNSVPILRELTYLS